MDLNSLQTFIAVVRAGGFSAAAREIDAPRSSVSAKIRNLEKDLGVRLFKRSTRAFSLTAEGQTLYLHSAVAMTSLISAVSSVTRCGESFSGEIRITLPADFPHRSSRRPLPNIVTQIQQCASTYSTQMTSSI